MGSLANLYGEIANFSGDEKRLTLQYQKKIKKQINMKLIKSTITALGLLFTVTACAGNKESKNQNMKGEIWKLFI